MEATQLQLLAAGMFCGFILLVCLWQLISTALAKRRRIKREIAQKAAAAAADGAGI